MDQILVQEVFLLEEAIQTDLMLTQVETQVSQWVEQDQMDLMLVPQIPQLPEEITEVQMEDQVQVAQVMEEDEGEVEDQTVLQYSLLFQTSASAYT